MYKKLEKKKGIVLLSGGLDSTVSLGIAKTDARMNIPLTIFFNYGQKAVTKERIAARKISQYFGISLREIKLPWLKEISQNSALVGPDKPIPKLKISDLKDKNFLHQTAQAVWVANRNGLFINIAASFAEAMGIHYIITGFNIEEGRTFPDNSLTFLRAINRSLACSTKTQVKVISFTARLTKRDIIKKGHQLGLPLQLTWSCYQDGNAPCGKCESCLRRKVAEEQCQIISG